MWARYTELGLGLWLGASPFVFGHAGTTPLIVHDLALGGLLVLVCALTHVRALSRLHLGLLIPAFWLVAAGWWGTWAGTPSEPAYQNAFQNWMVVGLTLMMLAIVPSHAMRPPSAWEDAADAGPDSGAEEDPGADGSSYKLPAERKTRSVEAPSGAGAHALARGLHHHDSVSRESAVSPAKGR